MRDDRYQARRRVIGLLREVATQAGAEQRVPRASYRVDPAGDLCDPTVPDRSLARCTKQSTADSRSTREQYFVTALRYLVGT